MKISVQIIFIAILLVASSCESNRKVAKRYSYFDLEGFFQREISRLQKLNPKVSKTVVKNTEAENRELRINDWEEELSLFTASDINKPAWKGSYKKSEKMGEILYTAIDPKLRTERLLIRRNKNGKVHHISIINKVSNSLYSSKENLTYYPDSLYEIRKEQKVRLLGSNKYTVTGRLK